MCKSSLLDSSKLSIVKYTYVYLGLPLTEIESIPNPPSNIGDTANIGDKATTEDYFAIFNGVTKDMEIDTVTGATWTSESIVSMVQAALAASE